MLFRVSTLLAQAGLTDATWFTDASRLRGHVVHDIAEQVFTGQPVAVAVEYDGYARALHAGAEALGLSPICVERRLTAGLVTGRPDLVGVLASRRGQLEAGPAIVDIKSGERYPSHGIQLAYYSRLADRVGLRQHLPSAAQHFPWQRVGLYVRPTGRFTLHLYSDMRDYAIADAILDLACWRAEHGLIQGTETIAQADDPTGPFEETRA